MVHSYLALGDSYTIGEQVPLAESFPYQVVQMLRKAGLSKDPAHNNGIPVTAPEIIAKTGWTTDELISAIDRTNFLPRYDCVSLLIGVNNQYRGRPVDNFEMEFEFLLQKAIGFAAGIQKNVYVLSIPDWGVTTFAKDRDIKKIAREIDAYNNVCERIASGHGAAFINITKDQRKDGADAEYLAGDGLHPSGKEYKKWAMALSELIAANLSRTHP